MTNRPGRTLRSRAPVGVSGGGPAALLAMTAAVLLLLPAGAMPGPGGSHTPPPVAAGPGARLSGKVLSSSPARESSLRPNEIGPTRRTLVLYNNTVLRGNFNQTGPLGPETVAEDSLNGDVFVAMTPVSELEEASPSTGSGVWSLPIPSGAIGAAFDPTNGLVYVAGGGSGNVTAVDPTSASIVGTYPVAGDLVGATWDPALGSVLLVDGELNELYAWSPTTDSVSKSVVVGTGPSSATVDPIGGDILVTNGMADSVSVVSPSTFTVSRTLPVGGTPVSAVYLPAFGQMMVADQGTANVTVLNSTLWTHVASVPTGQFPTGLALDPDTGDVLVTDLGSGNLTWVDPTTDRSSPGIAQLLDPAGTLYDPTVDQMLFVNEQSNNLTLLSGTTAAVVGGFPLGAYPEDLVYDTDNDLLYAAILKPGSVAVINPVSFTVTKWIPVGNGPTAIGFDAAQDRIYVADTGFASQNFAGNISVISGATNTLLTTFPSPPGPEDVVYDPVNGDMYIPDGGAPPSFDGEVSVINGTTDRYVTNITTGICQRPDGITFDPANDLVVLGCTGSPGIDVVNTTTNTFDRFIDLGTDTANERYNAYDGLLYATGIGGGLGVPEIAVLNGYTLHEITNVSVGTNLPTDLDVDPNDGTVGVAMENSGEVWLINPNNTVIAQLPAGAEPDAMGFDTTDGAFYVSGGTSGTESEIPVLVAAFFHATPGLFSLGNATSLTVGVPDGGAVQRFAYTGLPPGCQTANTSALSCTPSLSGTYRVEVWVNDTYGKFTTANATLVVNPDPRVVAFRSTPDPVGVGAPIELQATAENGTPPYAYAFSGLPPGCSASMASGGSLNCTPGQVGTFPLEVAVTDHDLKVGYGYANLTVDPGLTVSSFTASPSVGVEGASAAFSVVATGGVAPYAYVYANLPPGCSSANVAKLTCPLPAAGSYNLAVSVSDAGGDHASANLPFSIIGPLKVAAFTANPDPVALGSTTTFQVSSTGGAQGPTVAYLGLPPGCASSNTTALACTASAAGTYPVEVHLTDALGESAFGWTNLTVSASGGTSLLEILAVVGVAGLVLLLAIVVLVRRARKGRGAPEGAPADGPERPPIAEGGAEGAGDGSGPGAPSGTEYGPPPRA